MIVRPELLAGEALPPPPRQQRSSENRERLKAAALELFGGRGYEGTGVDDIAARARLAVGSFYQHYRSKRQLLLALMDELLDRLSRLELRFDVPADVRAALRELLARAFSTDLEFLGAYRAWQEAVLSDADLLKKHERIHAWTTARVRTVFERLQQLPGARRGLDLDGLARAMDSFFWSLIAQAVRLSRKELDRSLDAATHLIYHALFADPAKGKAR